MRRREVPIGYSGQSDLFSNRRTKHGFEIECEQKRFDEVWPGLGDASCGFGAARFACHRPGAGES